MLNHFGIHVCGGVWGCEGVEVWGCGSVEVWGCRVWKWCGTVGVWGGHSQIPNMHRRNHMKIQQDGHRNHQSFSESAPFESI